MSIDKSLRQHYEIQGGGPNYLGKQKMVKAPKKWKSSPGHEPAELAYITKKEKDILLDLNIYGSLKNGKPNRGPSGIISLQGDMGGYGGTGGGGGGGGEGRPHGGWSAPAPKPAPAPAAPTRRDVVPVKAPIKRDVIPTFVEPPKGDAPGREFAIATKNIIPTVDDYDYPGIDIDFDKPTRNIHVDTGPEIKAEQEIADELNRQKAIRDIIKQGQEEKFGDTADPTKFGETISKLDVAMSKKESDRTIDDKLAIEEWEKDQDWEKVEKLADKGHSSDDIQKAMDKGLLLKEDAIRRQGLIERGLAMLKPETKLESSLMGTLKKTFDPKRLATNFALRKLGLGWLNPILGIASLFGLPQKAKSMYAARKAPTFDPKKASQLGLYADRQPTDTTQFAKRVGQGTIGSDIVAGKKGILESGAELLGLKDIEGHRADLSANDIKLINYGKKHGLTTPTEIRETVGPGFNQEKPPTDAEIKGVLEGTITKPTGIFAAHGGRIDRPLTGRSRDI
jgi:hypothetical protein